MTHTITGLPTGLFWLVDEDLIKGGPGGSRNTWEPPLTSGDADLIIIEGSWPLPPRGR